MPGGVFTGFQVGGLFDGDEGLVGCREGFGERFVDGGVAGVFWIYGHVERGAAVAVED